MTLDTKTLWMALTVSNLLFGMMMLAYAYPGAERPVIRTWAVGQILKGIGIAGILFRPHLPAEMAFAGNSLIIVGYFVELRAFLGYGGRQGLQRPALLLLAVLLLIVNGAAAMTAHGWNAKHTATAFSFCMAVLTACSALAMLRSNRPRSVVQMVLVASNAMVALTFTVRALRAAASDLWVPDANMAINQVLFAVGYVFSITDGFGFLLLVKEDADRSLLRMATEDGLTGLPNRAAFMHRADECRRLCQRTGQPVAVVMMDVDHFKRINDTFGHAAGDLALVAIGRGLREHLRDVDICGRLGGEEFAMLLPGTSAEAAVHVAERLRHAVADAGFSFEGRTIGLTASFGVADPGPAGTLEQALSLADTALYTAKSEGRNRVVATSDRTARRTTGVVKLVT